MKSISMKLPQQAVLVVCLTALILLLTLPLGSDAAVLFDMEGAVGGWSAQGLWHITSGKAHSDAYSWWYGQESTG
ncbi:MAG: hypothetical protein ABIA75_08685, partial [Candidatus Neomarinimicrobiota bacterium]